MEPDDERPDFKEARRVLRKKKMAIRPPKLKQKSPLRASKRIGNLVTIKEDETDSINESSFRATSDKQSLVVVEEEDNDNDRFDTKLSRSVSFTGLISSSVEFVRSWSQYSLPFIEKNISIVSLPDLPSNDRRSTTFLFGVNLQSMVMGTSVLSFPFACSVGGIYTLPLVVIIGFLTSYTGSILIECLYQTSSTLPGVRKRVRSTFVEICTAVWPRYGQYVMETIVYFSLARNTVVLVLLTDLQLEILHGSLPYVDSRLWTCMWTIAVLPFLFIKRVSALAWVSFIGLLLYLVALVAILVSVVIIDHGWNVHYLSTSFDLQGIGLALGIIINSYAQHLAFPPLEGSMQNPANYKATVRVSFIVNILAKVAFALVGVLKFGPETAQTITGNLPSLLYVAIPIRVAIMFFTYFTVPMQSYVVFQLLDQKLLPHFPLLSRTDGGGNWAWLFLSRAILVTFCLLIAILIPDFSLIVSLIGSIRGTLVCLILPALFYFKLNQDILRWHQKVAAISVICLGSLFALIGLYGSVRSLFKM